VEQEKKDIGEANRSNREILEITNDAISTAFLKYGLQCGIKVFLQDLMNDSFWALYPKPENYCPNSGLTRFLCDRFGVTPDQIEITMQKELVTGQRYTIFVGSKSASLLFIPYALEQDIIEGQALIPVGNTTLEADDFE